MMGQTFEILFDAECPDIGSFRLFIQKSVDLYQLDEYHAVDFIIEQAYNRCQTTESAESVESVTQIRLAWLKTICLEIIQELSQAKNRQKFDRAVKALFDNKNPDSLSFCASITRTLRQYRLSKTYEAKEVISEAYTRGVKHIKAGNLIDVPLAWLRRTCLNVISELKRKQLKSDTPKFDPESCVVEAIAFSEIILQEDIQALQLAMNQLSPEDHQILSARIFQKLSWQEIGESMSDSNHLPLSPGTARQRGSRVLKKLRQHYQSIRDDVQLPNTGDS